MKFDEHQKIIVELDTGKHLVLAPPGSGKTEILTHRISRVLANGIDASAIACLTFTNRAARNMKDRFPEDAADVFVGNFHAWAIEYLREIEVFSSGHSVLDEEDSGELLNTAIQCAYKDLNIDAPKGEPATFLRKYSQECSNLRKQIEYSFDEKIINRTKERLVDRYHSLTNLYTPPDVNTCNLVLPIIHQHYGRLKEENICYDFDDLLNLSLYNLIQTKNQRSKSKYAYFSWVQIDEVQDLNHIQWAILKSISNSQSHILALGDIDQTIFSFIGSSFEMLTEETQDYKQHSLVINYRSPTYLLKLFNKYASYNFNKELNITANNQNDNREENCKVILCENEDAQLVLLKETLLNDFNTSKSDDKFALLFRRNNDASLLSGLLEKMNVWHFLVSDHDIFRKRNAKDFMSILSVLNDPHSKLSWQRLFYTFSNTKTLTESRNIVNELFSAFINPADILHSNQSIYQANLLSFRKTVSTRRCIVFDTETTGTDTDSCDIIQIAAIELLNGKPNTEFEVYLKTAKDLGASVKIHKISNTELNKKGINRTDALEEFFTFINHSTLIAHNLNFDWSILQANLKRELGKTIKNDHSRFCTLQMSRTLWPNLSNHKLETLLKIKDIDGKNTHNAMDDVRATCNLVQKIIEDYDQKAVHQDNILSKHKKVLASFESSFQPIWHELNSYINRKTSFRDIFRRYFNYIAQKKPSYDLERLSEVETKIIRHMDRYCGEDKLKRLLENHLFNYQVYKEPDLILEEDQIVLSTIHRSKGLQFDTIYLPSCRDGIYPLHWIKQKKELDEEARLLYVALTRSKKQIVLLRPKSFKTYRGLKKSNPSRWLKNLRDFFQEIEITNSDLDISN